MQTRFRWNLVACSVVVLTGTACAPGGGGGADAGSAGDSSVSEAPAPTEGFARATAAPVAGQPVFATTPDGEAGRRYIVTILQPGAMSTDSIEALAERVVERDDKGEVVHVYSRALKGFAAVLSDAEADRLRTTGKFSVVPDEWARAFETQPNPPSWGIDRVDQRALALDNAYSFQDTGEGVHVYVIDSGIRTSHSEFGGNRARHHLDLQGGDGSDLNGHGTHVAGTVGGITFGVAKRVNIHTVRVLDDQGFGPWSDIIKAIDSVIVNHQKPAIINMSLGGDAYEPVDMAVRRAVGARITVVAAAGNDGDDACGTSPAREPLALTVGATTRADELWPRSNHGRCVDILAPGHAIVSASHADDQNNASKSGTSMAAPHVAGAAALFLQRNPTATPAQVAARLISTATRDAVQDAPSDTENRLLFIGPP